MSAHIKTWQDEASERGLTAYDAGECMVREISELRAALASHQGVAAVADPMWRVAEFWSSAKPGSKVLMLAVGEKEIAEWGARGDFLRWLVAPQPPAVKEAEPLRPAPARTTSDAAYEAMSLDRRKKFDADMLVMEQQMQDHRRSRERRKLSVPVEVEQRVADRRGKIG